MTNIDKDNLMTITASPIVGSVVKTPQDKTIGEISGVILNTITGEVPFALLTLDDNNSETKGKQIAISWEDFEDNSGHSQEFILDQNKVDWHDLPQFNAGYQPPYSQHELMDSIPFIHGWARPQHLVAKKIIR